MSLARRRSSAVAPPLPVSDDDSVRIVQTIVNLTEVEKPEPLEQKEKYGGNVNRGVPDHDCGLPLYEHGIIRYINSGLFVELRRKLKKLTMVSTKDQHSRALFKSTYQIRQEEQKHLQKHYYMIHPFSKARFGWETAMIFVYFAQLVLIPLEISTADSHDIIYYPNLFLDMVSLVDIILFFRTGYLDKKQQKVIMRPKTVATHYLKTFFFIDLLSSTPFSFVMRLKDSWSHLWPLKLLMVFKVGRITKMIGYLEKFCEHNNIWSYNLKVLNFGICFALLFMWATGVENLLRETTNTLQSSTTSTPANLSYVDQMLESCFLVTVRLMLVGLAKSADTNYERVKQALGLYIGGIFNLIILAQIIQIYNRRTSARNKFDNLMQQIIEYMKYKELPQRLRAKVFRYVNFKFQKNVFKESDVFSTLSSRLKDEISLHNCQKLVEKVNFFQDAPITLILRLVTKMKSEIYLPNDVIVQAGIAGNAMYFIHLGTVAVYAINGKEICHLHDGSHFGEISLVINEPRVATVVAVKDCEVFRLSRRDYQEAISPFPEFANRIRRSAMGRLASTKKLLNRMNTEALPTGDDSSE